MSLLRLLLQLATCPIGTQAASLDIAKAYRNSPIIPDHKRYLAILWRGHVYIQHVAIEGLATAGGIQGTVADVCIQILAHHGIHPVIEWVVNFVFFREPSISAQPLPHAFPYDLTDVFSVTKPLGIPWHSISKKGQDFAPHFDYVGFSWDIAKRSVTVPDEKRLHAIAKLRLVLSTSTLSCCDIASIHGTLQHLTFFYRDGRHSLSSLSNFLANFPNDFIKHHLPMHTCSDLLWWQSLLTRPNIS